MLPTINASPIYPSRLASRPNHENNKLQNLISSLPSTSKSLTGIEPLEVQNTQKKAELFDEMMRQLQDKFNEMSKQCDKLQLLTLLPKSMSVTDIKETFNTSRHMAERAKYLQREYGVMFRPELNRGKRLSADVTKAVIDYYNDDDVSRIMPGRNDCLSVKVGHQKVKVQKRLMLCSLKESYEGFKKQHEQDPSKKIGFSKFSILKPKNCVLPGSSGTHKVCVCTIHQNVKLIIIGAMLESVTNGRIKSYKDCISEILCPIPSSSCYLLECKRCPGTSVFCEYLKTCFVEYEGENCEVSFDQWVATDRCDFKHLTLPLSEFLNYFIKKLKKLIPHYFTSSQQSEFVKILKSSLKDTEVLVQCDFSENYSFVLQNAAQGFHWNKKQATIHPFVIYFKNSNGDLAHYTFVAISDCLSHDTVAVKLFIDKLINFLKVKIPNISKIFYVTDGSAAQYKNKKNFMNLIKHKEDYGIDCEWHFFATSHGKGACDGVGGTIKRMAAKASLIHEKNCITTAEEFYNWTQTLETDMYFVFCSTNEYQVTNEQLSARFKNLKVIPGTQKFHAFIPQESGNIKCKKFSNSEKFQIFNVS